MPDDDLDISLYYRLKRLDNNNSVIVKRDAGPPTIISGGGRWTIVNRPRRGSFTTWEGDDPYRMDVPILIDGWPRRSVEDDIAIIQQMRHGRLGEKNKYSPPPKIKIDGALPVKDADAWVLETDTDWGDNVIWHPDGYRLRQDCVIHLLQFQAVKNVAIKPPATSHTYTVKKGDTLKSISRSQYGTPLFWSTIKNANNIRDIKKLPKTLKIPTIIGK